MAKTVREIDEEKIKDAKEDIDNLLVFVSPSPSISCSVLLNDRQHTRLDCSRPC